MIKYQVLLFYSILSFGILFICIFLSFVRKRITNALYANINLQPYSSKLISKMHILAMAFLETPLVLSIVLSILSFDLLYYANEYICFLPVIYIFVIFISALITIYYSGYYIGSLISVASLHPQYESKLMIQLFLFLSTLQAPFIILFVLILYNKYYLLSQIDMLFFNKWFFIFIGSLYFMMLIMQFALCQAINKLLFYIKDFYNKYPAQIGKILFLLIMHMGFFQAPYIFGFIIFIILSKFFLVSMNYLYSVFSLLVLFFGVIGSVIIYQSGNAVHSSIKKLGPTLEKNKKIMHFTLLSQIILDSRILYILLIILFSFNFF